jgi:SAM-dependent methyltransferase
VLQATQPGPERFAFVEIDVEAADVTAAQAFPGSPFDLVYARLLLHHLREPVAMLRKLAAWVRPGGLVVVQDYDVPAIDIWPPLTTWGEFERVVFGVYEQTGRDLRSVGSCRCTSSRRVSASPTAPTWQARSASPPSSAGCMKACTGACCRPGYGWG